jgi:acylphosphatase
VRGVVQGVGFRAFVLRAARRLELEGWAANAGDGSVRVVAEGEESSLEALLEALHDGPPGARVREVLVSRPPATGREGAFHVRAGGHRGD